MLSLAAVGFMALAAVPAQEEPALVLESRHLTVTVSRRDGALVGLRHRRAGLELLSCVPEERQPWLLLLEPAEFVSDIRSFQAERADQGPTQRLRLRWQTAHDITVRAELSLAEDADRLEVRCQAENRGERVILALNYPRLQGIGPLTSGGEGDRLLHAAMAGALVKDPFHLFDGAAQIPQARGFLPCRYPNGFGGSPLQLMAYYAVGRGGFSITAEDPYATDKDFNFYKHPDNRRLTAEIAHFQWEARSGADLRLDYPVVIAALQEGNWYEPAERYREWALRQPWCARGTLRDRVRRGDASRWLLEEIGAVGMWWNFDGDRRDAVAATRAALGAPLLHLEMHWQDRVSVEAAREGGGQFGPFYFPFVALEGSRTYAECAADQLVPRASPVVPKWMAMCPAQPGWRRVAVETAEDLAGAGPLRHHQVWIDGNPTGCAADALYYDVGPSAGVPTHCYADGHQHPRGAGRQITEAYVSLTQETQRRASAIRGAYVPVGTECVGEPFIPGFDFAYARAAGFDLGMEVMPYLRVLTWVPDGQMEIVPLWEFVYHEVGPLVVQGLHLTDPWRVPESEDMATWAEARATLWGELMVTMPTAGDVPQRPERRRFLHSLTAARTGFARDFLAYGRLQRPPEIKCPTITLDHGLAKGGWWRRSAGLDRPQEEQAPAPPAPAADGAWSEQEWVAHMMQLPVEPARQPVLAVPVVLAQAYTLGEDRLGILLINLRREGTERVEVSVDPVACGLRPGDYRLQRAAVSGAVPLPPFTDRTTVIFDLPPREFVLLEACWDRAQGNEER